MPTLFESSEKGSINQGCHKGFYSDLYLLYLLKLPAPPRAALLAILKKEQQEKTDSVSKSKTNEQKLYEPICVKCYLTNGANLFLMCFTVVAHEIHMKTSHQLSSASGPFKVSMLM